MTTKNEQLECTICNYSTTRKSNYKRHLQSNRHISATNPVTPNKPPMFTCECGLTYKHRGSLYNHALNCTQHSKLNTIVRKFVLQFIELGLCNDRTNERTTDRTTDRPTERTTDRTTDRPTDRTTDRTNERTNDTHVITDMVMYRISETQQFQRNQNIYYARRIRDKISNPNIKTVLDTINQTEFTISKCFEDMLSR